MKLRQFLLACCTVALPALAFTNEPLVSHFECKDFGNSRYRPYYLKAIHGSQYQDFSLTPKGLLGQNAMKSVDECERALEAANHEFGVICSRTGLDGWKPTLYTGTVPGRPDFGYLGGSSIMRFEDCLTATRHSSQKGVCFWGGSSWYVSPIDHEGLISGPFSSVEDCAQTTSGLENQDR
ncbi:MAG: hypothetical protein KDD51_15575 [Bdellovibrionales bacterium]|nr:hypothetical protein [Bdellovibrionales bacterium]